MFVTSSGNEENVMMLVKEHKLWEGVGYKKKVYKCEYGGKLDTHVRK
jgi:hypothetical protein